MRSSCALLVPISGTTRTIIAVRIGRGGAVTNNDNTAAGAAAAPSHQWQQQQLCDCGG